MKYSLILLGCCTSLITFAPIASAKTSAEIEAIARSVSVKIQVVGKGRTGSGVIVHRQGDLYTLVTNRHVVCGSRTCKLSKETYTLTMADGQLYKIATAGVKLSGEGLDLAIIQFPSNRQYPVPQVADPGSLKVNDAVYTAGFPKGSGFFFGQGQARAIVSRRLVGDNGGYTVIYNAETLPGMSGGGVFDQQGRLVAIHGYGDRYTENTQGAVDYAKAEVGSKIGYNRGIPLRWIVQELSRQGLVLGDRRSPPVSGTPGEATTADEFFIAGFNKIVEPGIDVQRGWQEAWQQLSRAIALKPNYTAAYFMRAYLSIQMGSYKPALADLNQAIALDPNFANAYNNRALLKNDKLKDRQGALMDYDKAIALNPNFWPAYFNRGNLKDDLEDNQGALADYNQAIILNPQFANAYTNRGNLKINKLNDPQGALADYNQAILLNPSDAVAYGNRALLKYQSLNDRQGALADFNQSIVLDPNSALVYTNRGNLKDDKFNDLPGALADYNKAIAIDGNFALAYYNRGVLKQDKLQDRPGAIQDFRKAAQLFRQQGQTRFYSVAIQRLKELGVTE